MPVEIKELVIRARVQEAAPESAGGGSGCGPSEAGSSGGGEIGDQRALVEECVRRTLEILRRERER